MFRLGQVIITQCINRKEKTPKILDYACLQAALISIQRLTLCLVLSLHRGWYPSLGIVEARFKPV